MTIRIFLAVLAMPMIALQGQVEGVLGPEAKREAASPGSPSVAQAMGLDATAEEAAQAPLPAARVMVEAPVLSAQEELRTFRLPPGFRIELVAADPLVHDPVAAAFDLEGNLWVAEFSTYNSGLIDYLPALAPGISLSSVPKCKIVELESSHHDGRFDRRIVWLDGLEMARGLAIVHDGVLISDSPHLWLARDVHGTGRCDEETLLVDGYEATVLPQVSVRQGRWAYQPTTGDVGRTYTDSEYSGSLIWGRDNILRDVHFPYDYRYRRGTVSPLTVPIRGQFGISQDDFGRLFFNHSIDQLDGDLFAPAYGVRNPDVTEVPWAAVRIAKDEEVWPSHPTPAVDVGFERAILGKSDGGLRDNGTLQEFTAACSPLIYRGTNFPAPFYGNAFVCEPSGNLIKRDILREARGRLTAVNAYRGREFLTSTDSRFRPVALLNAPDGSLLVVDMYRGIIQDYHYLTHYLANQSLGRGLGKPMFGPGRIFRIVYDGGPLDTTQPDLAHLSAIDLAALLAKPNAWWRDTAQQEIVERGDLAAVPALEERALHAQSEATRDAALWTLDGLGATTPELLQQALADRSPHVRAAAVRLHERWLGGSDSDAMVRQLMSVLQDSEAEVSVQLALTLGEAKTTAGLEAMDRVLLVDGRDSFVPTAIATGLNGREFDFFEKIGDQLAAAEARPGMESMVTILSSAIVHRADRERIRQLIARAGDAGGLSKWARLAVLRGFEPLLRPAFRRSVGLARVAGSGDLAPLLASSDRDVRDLAENLSGNLAREEEVERQRAAAARPLTPHEQELYEQGKIVFQVCAACHQQTGTGLPNVAPSLVDSHWVGSSPEMLVRIILDGKEGKPGFGPMPPIGGAFTDEQIASALTYIRNSWGLRDGAVTPGAVAKVRKEIGKRQAPWTDADLLRLEGGGRVLPSS